MAVAGGTRRPAVLQALKGAPDGVSGEVLAARLGVSRVAVGKHISALRALGYEIDAALGTGYRLVGVPDLPLPLEVAPLLESGFWTRIEGGGSTGSTNDDVRALAQAGAPEGTAVLASEQTGGRGRLGREWSSPAGGVYLSGLLRPAGAPSDVSVLSLVVGLGVARGLEALGARASLKWPNDVILGEGKLAGILLESMTEGETVAWVIAGCGINVCRPARGRLGAAYLEDAVGTAVPLARVAAAVLDGLAGAYRDWGARGFAPLLGEYEKRDALLGAPVAVFDLSGRQLAEGTAAGVDEYGRLVVNEPDGPRVVASGEVTLRRP